MSFYMVVSENSPSQPQTQEEILQFALSTGFLHKKSQSFEVHGVHSYWSCASISAQAFANNRGEQVQVIRVYPSGSTSVVETFNPKTESPKPDPLVPEDLALDPYDGVPADTGTV